MNKTKSGFTIVELLIVIVVIGILAAITIVTYNGVQQRANNAQIISAARSYKQAFALYLAQNGQMPPMANGPVNYCLGHSVATCVSSGAAANWTRDTTSLEPALSSVISPLPTPNYSTVTYTAYDPNMGYVPYRGGTSSPTLDGVNSAFLIYILAGYTNCPVGPVASGAWPNYSSSNSNSYTWQNSGLTGCWVPLSSS